VTFFATETMVWQFSTEGHEDLFQGSFANMTHRVGEICDNSRRKIIAVD